jgi:hypothetical protein
MTFYEKINLFQANMWVHYILMDFTKAQEKALQWFNQFEAEPHMKAHDPHLFMRAFYYVLVTCFLQKDHSRYLHYLDRFENFVDDIQPNLNENSSMTAFVYLELARMNEAFLRRNYQQVLGMEEKIKRNIHKYRDLLDPHRVLLFNYKLAYAKFGLGDFEGCLDTLNQIVHSKDDFLRFDLLFAARVLHIICHYELGNYDLIESLHRSCRRSFSRRGDMTALQNALMDLPRTLTKSPTVEHPKIFSAFFEKNAELYTSNAERRTLSFFELKPWIEKHAPSLINP